MRTLEHLALTLTENHGGQYADHLLTLKQLTPYYSTSQLITYYKKRHYTPKREEEDYPEDPISPFGERL